MSSVASICIPALGMQMFPHLFKIIVKDFPLDFPLGQRMKAAEIWPPFPPMNQTHSGRNITRILTSKPKLREFFCVFGLSQGAGVHVVVCIGQVCRPCS